MSNYIRIILIISLCTSCMQVTTKKKLDFNGEDSSAVNRPDGNYPDGSSYNNNTNSGSGSSDSGIPPAPHITEFIESRSMNVRFGDYKFISAMLTQKYGSNCSSTIRNNIWNKAEIFGAVCDYYDRDNSCNDAKDITALALTSTMRAGRLMKTCEEIAMNGNCISYYLQQAGLNSSSSFTSPNILRAFKVFYPLTDTLASEEEDAFIKLASKFTNTSDKWKAMSLALCISPKWQIP